MSVQGGTDTGSSQRGRPPWPGRTGDVPRVHVQDLKGLAEEVEVPGHPSLREKCVVSKSIFQKKRKKKKERKNRKTK